MRGHRSIDSTIQRLTLVAAMLASAIATSGCDDDDTACDSSRPDDCPSGQRCTDDGQCARLPACDPADATSCPGGFVCRPSESGPVCEPTFTAGRIPSCIDSDGLDLFAVEADGALSVTWNVNVDLDSGGGFRAAHGPSPDRLDDAVEVAPDVREVTLAPLPNGTERYVVVQALSAAGNTTFTSCTLVATPHRLAFGPDRRVTDGGTQTAPDIASNLEGTRLYLLWVEDDTVQLAVSEDFGESWSTARTVAPGGGQAEPAIAVREAVLDSDGEVLLPEAAVMVWQESGRVWLTRMALDDDRIEGPIEVGAGGEPDVAVGANGAHVAFSDGGAIRHAFVDDREVTATTSTVISGDVSMSGAPSLNVDPFTDGVFVGWHGLRGGGDSDIYMAAALDGRAFGPAIRIDDDRQGQNQREVSLVLDPRSQTLYATWEDRRGGANIFFAASTDWGESWSENIDVGAGFSGDQFRPQVVVDVSRNVYVGFQDTTNGQRVVFSRFNADGTFDPPLAPSSQAGSMGTVADRPTVATDRYGTVYIAWQENRGGARDTIYFARGD